LGSIAECLKRVSVKLAEMSFETGLAASWVAVVGREAERSGDLLRCGASVRRWCEQEWSTLVEDSLAGEPETTNRAMAVFKFDSLLRQIDVDACQVSLIGMGFMLHRFV
jgi:hypothetical protein